MKSLESLKNLLYSLRKDEIHSVFKFIKMNLDIGERSTLKSIQLIEIILDNKTYTAVDLQKTIYGDINRVAFNKLVNRLYDKILEVICLEPNINRGSFSDRAKMVFHLRKKMIVIDLLIIKGLRSNLDREIDAVISKSKEFEVYDILVQALYSKQRFNTLSGNLKNAQAVADEIVHAEKCWLAFNTSQSIFNTITSKINASSGGYSYERELNETLDKLRYNYELTNSPTIGYNYYFLLAEKAQKENKFESASSCFKKLQNILDSNKSVYSNLRYGTTLLNIANNGIYLSDLENSLQLVQNAKEYFVGSAINISICEEIEIYILIYLGQIETSQKLINNLLRSPRSIQIPLLLSKWKYLSGALHFIQGRFRESLNILNEAHEIEMDKEGWNFYKRILVLMARIELNDSDSADLKLQSLDKFMKRISKSNSLKPRLLLIVRILRKLINENYNFSKVYHARKKYFELLCSNDANYKWQPKSPEIIIFQDWFTAKMEGANYNPVATMDNHFLKDKIISRI